MAVSQQQIPLTNHNVEETHASPIATAAPAVDQSPNIASAPGEKLVKNQKGGVFFFVELHQGSQMMKQTIYQNEHVLYCNYLQSGRTSDDSWTLEPISNVLDLFVWQVPFKYMGELTESGRSQVPEYKKVPSDWCLSYKETSGELLDTVIIAVPKERQLPAGRVDVRENVEAIEQGANDDVFVLIVSSDAFSESNSGVCLPTVEVLIAQKTYSRFKAEFETVFPDLKDAKQKRFKSMFVFRRQTFSELFLSGELVFKRDGYGNQPKPD